MGVTIFRPGQRLVIPGVTVMQPRPSAAAGGWWDVAGQTCIAAYQPKGAASLAASYVNLANPGTYDAAPGVAPTWDSTGGWTFNGSTQYLTTGIVGGSAWTYIIRFSDGTDPSSFKSLFGARNSSLFLFIRPAHSTVGIGYYHGDGLAAVLPNATTGVVAMAAKAAYRNGAFDGTVSGGNTMPTSSIFVGGQNSGGALAEAWPGKIQALAIYSTTLSGADVATLTTAMAAL